MIDDRFKELLRRCEQCGTCTASCPASDVSEFNIRRLVRHCQLGLENDKEFLSKQPWLCTQCGRCEALCTEGLEIPELVMALREVALKTGAAPEAVRKVLATINGHHSPFVSASRTKKSWIDASVQVAPEAGTLFWVGCTPAMMAPQVPKATAAVLNKLGLKFKLLDDEPCCAEPLIGLGLMEDAKAMAGGVAKAIMSANVTKVVTACSGCFNAFSNLYPKVLGIQMSGIEIVHISQLLEQNLSNAASKLEKPLRIAYHDPCSLGRHAKVFDAPRNVLKAIEGVTLVELPAAREFSTCCGGGGGVSVVHPDVAANIAAKKLRRELAHLGVDVLVTCCPMCLLSFRRALAKLKSPVKVMDLAEVVALSVS